MSGEFPYQVRRGNISVQLPSGTMEHYTDAAFFAVIIHSKPGAQPDADGLITAEVAVRIRADNPEETEALLEVALPAALAKAISAMSVSPEMTIEALTSVAFGIAAQCHALQPSIRIARPN